MKRVVVILLFLGACLPLQQSEVQVPQDVYVGTSGLEVQFGQSTLREVQMCNELTAYVDVRNAGAFDVEQGVYSFLVEEDRFDILQPNQRKGAFDLEGRSQYNPYGGLTQVSLKVRSRDLPSNFESYESPVVVQSCYPYMTTASVPVCIDPDVQGLQPRKTCVPEPVKLSGGQGAPVAVTEVETYMNEVGEGVRPAFVVFVQDLGAGRVVHESGIDVACGGERLRETEGMPDDFENDPYLALMPWVNVKAKIGESELSCAPFPVRLDERRAVKVICEGDTVYPLSGGTFETILSLELSYGYVTEAVAPVTISRLPGQSSCGQRGMQGRPSP